MPSSQSFGVHLLVSCVLADEKRHLGRRRTGPYLFGSLQILNIGHLPHFSRFIISPRRYSTRNTVRHHARRACPDSGGEQDPREEAFTSFAVGC